MQRIALLSMLLMLASPVHAADPEANKKVVIDFYEKALNQKDFEAAAQHFGPRYIQHNPGAPDGIEGFKAFIAMRKEKSPNAKSCLLYTSPSPRDRTRSRMPSSA